MEDVHSPLLVGTAAMRDAAQQRGPSAERRSASLPVSELSPPPGELSEDSFICHICLVSPQLPGGTLRSSCTHGTSCMVCGVCML